MKLLSTISPRLESSPYRIGLAINNQWNRAWKIQARELPVSRDRIKEYLSVPFSMVEVETHYKMKDRADFFFGIGYDNTSSNVENPFDFINRYLTALNQENDKTLVSMVKKAGLAAGNKTGTLLRGLPDSIIISNMDCWGKNHIQPGACTIWSKNQTGRFDRQFLTEKLRNYSYLLSYKRDFSSLECISNTPIRHWASFQVSDKRENGVYVLNFSKVEKILGQIFNNM